MKESIEYFKNNQEFNRIFMKMKIQWEKYGRIAGYIVLKDPTPGELKVLGSFLHRNFTDEIRFKMAHFEESLKDTIFSGVSLQDLLEGYFDSKLVTNKQTRINQKAAREQFFGRLQSQLKNPRVANWCSQMIETKSFGYKLMVGQYREDKKRCELIITSIDRAINQLETTQMRLALIGALVTGDPHYFDRANLAGKILINFLAFEMKQKPPFSSEEILSLYYEIGIIPDDISSSVVIRGINLYSKGTVHPGVAGFNQLNQHCVVTLANLADVDQAQAKGPVFVVENQMVFSMIAAKIPSNIALVCTSGQLKVAGLKLLDLLSPETTIYYSGDFDPEGLGICARLLARHHNIIPWGYTLELYQKSLSQNRITPQSLAKLNAITEPRLQGVKNVIATTQLAGYQENILDYLIEDLKSKTKE